MWISPDKPALVLAPMEGVTDSPMRALFSEHGAFSFCVAEFLRISHEVLPAKVYLQHLPELAHGCRTPSGIPVQLQLLGGNEDLMARSAVKAYELGARAIDINFGCPAPIVNRHDGGAAILRYPMRIKSIVSAVRQALPRNIPLSAKLRLGWDSLRDIYTNAHMAAQGGASWITIHARTKMQGYAPPVHWGIIAQVRRQLDIPVVANGDIWTREDFLRCAEETGCRHFMLGRGALADPGLSRYVASQLGLSVSPSKVEWKPLLERFIELNQWVSDSPNYSLCRIKQWLKMAHRQKTISSFEDIKQARTLQELMAFFP